MRFTLTMAALTAAAITLTACKGDPPDPAPAPSSTQPANDTPTAWADKTRPVISNLGEDFTLIGHLLLTAPDRDPALLHTACRHLHYDATRLRNRLPAPDDQINEHTAKATDHLKALTDQCLAATEITKPLVDQINAAAGETVTETKLALDRADALK
ncbi:hypothetical protein VST63_11175 [Mycolicibacterium sp. 050232]|uniref:hypothetical protein n=1 Tax=Mycolicibacterium sp. 050232 TaxID=3113982 RepID=UPI002E2E35D4|nr:hypothetical protein [Mycolicibacterium sp. 050232]MED5812922.1 hypothetical protein [Mycolicibacterium sp. 050232]